MLQKFTSAQTSINSKKLPAVFSKVEFSEGTKNLDYGAGKYAHLATEFLKGKNVENFPFDPFNVSDAENRNARQAFGSFDTATLSNVLNVIEERAIRKNVLEKLYYALKVDGRLYITVYEGNKTGKGKQTGLDSYQLNKKLREYENEVLGVFSRVEYKNGVLIASNI